METKQCPRCNETKSIDDFYTFMSRHGVRTARKHCKICSKKIQEEWQASKGTTLTEYHSKWHKTRIEKDPQHNAKRKIRMWEIRLGLPRGWFDQQLARQNGLCAICQKPEVTASTRKHYGLGGKRLAIDHCHKEMRARGLLCMSCNVKLAVLEDSEFGKNAQIYLMKHRT